MKDALLVGVGEATKQRQYIATAGRAVFEMAAKLVDVPLAGQKYKDVAFEVVIDNLSNLLSGGFDHRKIAVLFVHRFDGPVISIHWIHATGYLDDRSTIEGLGETLSVDRRGGDDDL